VGPNPALNAYIRSKGSAVRVLSGAVEGGAALVVQRDSRIQKPADFKGARLATPQLGNTQDVAARAWLKKNGLSVTLTGGDLLVIPTANADQLALFKQKKLDGVWTVEPWVSRLVLEAEGRVFLEQKDALVTLLVARTKALDEKADLIAAFKAAHEELTRWILEQPELAMEKTRQALSAEFKREVKPDLMQASWQRLHFTNSISREQFETLVKEAQSAGFLQNAIPLDRLLRTAP
jgi:NitT/TauT family transport system substrate-binding protein